MREDAFSGGSGAGGITTKNAGDVLAFNAMPQDSPSPAFVVGVQPSGSQSATTAIFRRPPRQTKKQNREDLQRHLSRPEVRDAFRRQWENAKNKADSIVRSA